MICPNCNKNVSDDKEFCDSCGSALFGPKSILLNEPELNGSMNKNNISSITGIDINSISNNSSVYTPFSSGISSHDTGATNNQEKKNFDIKNIVMIIMVVILVILICYIFFFNNNSSCPKLEEKKCPECPVSDCKVQNTGGYKVSTDSFVFDLPSGAIYSESNGYVHIRTNSLTMRVYPVTTGNIDRITASSYKNMYTAYSNTNVVEDVVNNKKLIMVTFDTGGAFFVNFYYQLDGGKIIYGEANSLIEKDVTSQTLKNIVASFASKDSNPVISYDASGFEFNNVLSMLR